MRIKINYFELYVCIREVVGKYIHIEEQRAVAIAGGSDSW